ncbi:MAG TPA: adenylate/guanylate cyclase domain-containing protein, partial [Saprospiraceae bacterium]|nr:adenylate/guanylate cyclase domain-containing protein [Saprospiraceae bacterium]
YLQNLREAYNVGVESNDIIYAGYAVTFINRAQLYMGEELDRVYEKLVGYIQFTHKIQSIVSLHQMLPWTRMIIDLAQIEPNAALFGEQVKEEDHYAYVKSLAGNGLLLPLAQYYTAKSMYHYILGHYQKSLDFSLKAQPHMASVLGLPEWAEHQVFQTLSMLALHLDGQLPPNKEAKSWKKNLKLMQLWAVNSPRNYESKYLLAYAESLVLANDIEHARAQFNLAIQSSQESGMKYMTALIYERLAAMNFRLKETELAEKHIHQALIEYQQWGAKAKVSQLLEQHSFLRSAKHAQDSGKKSISSNSLDLESVLKAASSLSSEVVLEKLLEKLLLILVENAGAQNAYLLRNRNNQLYVDASSRMSNEFVCEIKSYPLEEGEGISHAVVRRVNNSKESIIIDDAEKDPMFSKDPQSRKLKVKSILCMPILSKGEMLSILYLDNAASAYTFTRNRLEILNLLSGQIAVSLENAQLYSNLEQKVLERTSTIEKQKVELEEEKHRTETLLLNILPEEIAEELKTKGSSKPQRHESVTIMFTDFEKFTLMSEKLSPEEIVEIVDYHYKAFDKIIEKYNIEKIKTMGDAYMCVSGLPRPHPDHAIRAALAALEILDFVQSYNASRRDNGLPFCQIRIGLHTGPVVAGVVGLNKFAYDIWGDSVNTASRMQSVSEPGRINISNTTFELIRDRFKCTHRGKIKVKYKDDIDMYYVDQKID